MNKPRDILTGRSRDHVLQFENTHTVIHKDMENAVRGLRAGAREAGFDLAIASSFRDYNAQLSIWNMKATGKRPVLDSQGVVLEISKFSKEALVRAILRWSSLPGASRHHWGTEIDVFDRNSLPKDYKLQLIPREAAPGGIFSHFNTWLDSNIGSFGFFRPYAQERGGVSPEWWHLSYAPISQRYFEQFTLPFIQSVLSDAEFELKSVVLSSLAEIYNQFIVNISLPASMGVVLH
jgi:LAS superfamily LD-carboxypeptidase LdcB